MYKEVNGLTRYVKRKSPDHFRSSSPLARARFTTTVSLSTMVRTERYRVKCKLSLVRRLRSVKTLAAWLSNWLTRYVPSIRMRGVGRTSRLPRPPLPLRGTASNQPRPLLRCLSGSTRYTCRPEPFTVRTHREKANGRRALQRTQTTFTVDATSL